MAKKKAAANAATAEERAAKKRARLEALKNRPEGQRCNSRQMDIIEIEGAGKVLSYGYAIRRTGTLVTTVALNKAGEIVAVSSNMILGTKLKCKKGHGTLVPGLAGMGKGHVEPEADNEEEAEGDED